MFNVRSIYHKTVVYFLQESIYVDKESTNFAHGIVQGK